MVYSRAWGNLIHEKNQKSKISWHCPFKETVVITVFYILKIRLKEEKNLNLTYSTVVQYFVCRKRVIHCYITSLYCIYLRVHIIYSRKRTDVSQAGGIFRPSMHMHLTSSFDLSPPWVAVIYHLSMSFSSKYRNTDHWLLLVRREITPPHRLSLRDTCNWDKRRDQVRPASCSIFQR